MEIAYASMIMYAGTPEDAALQARKNRLNAIATGIIHFFFMRLDQILPITSDDVAAIVQGPRLKIVSITG